MNTAMQAVTAYYTALGQKDKPRVRETLAKEFSFKGPMMAFGDPDSFAEAMVAMPFEGTATGSRFIADGESVAHVFTWQMTSPTRAEIPMCEILTVANGKIVRSELFFDTKLFPAA